MPVYNEYLEAIKEESLEKLGYFLRPEELFTEVAKRGMGDKEDGTLFDDAMSISYWKTSKKY
jgi:type I restriction enzyme M protein